MCAWRGEVAIKVETCPMLPLDCPPDFHLMPLNFSLKAFQEKVSLWTPITTPWQVAHGKTTRRVRTLGSLYSRSQDPSEVGSLTLLVRFKSWLWPFHHKTGFTSLFCRLQGKLRHGPLPVTVLPCWPRFMTPTFGQSSADHESTETTHCSFFFFFFTTHCSYFIILRADPWVSGPLKVQRLSPIRKRMT